MVMGTTQGLSSLDNPTKIEEYVSPEQTYAAAGEVQVAHGLSKKPQIVTAFLRCKTVSASYEVGDEVELPLTGHALSTDHQLGTSCVVDATNITLRMGTGSNVFILRDETTGSSSGIGTANWVIIIKAYAFTIGDVPDITTVGLVPIETKSVAGVANVDINLDINKYESFQLEFIVQPVTNNAFLELLSSSDNGVSFDTGAGDYTYSAPKHSTSTGFKHSDGATELTILSQIGNTGGEGASATLKILFPADTNLDTRFHLNGGLHDGGILEHANVFGGSRQETNIVNAIRLGMDTGNIAFMRYTLYGLRKVA